MRFFIFSLLVALFFGVASAIVQQKAFIVTYPENTPSGVIDHAMQMIKDAGGLITHEYQLIRGFAAKAPIKIFETISAQAAEHQAVVEEDQMVSIDVEN